MTIQGRLLSGWYLPCWILCLALVIVGCGGCGAKHGELEILSPSPTPLPSYSVSRHSTIFADDSLRVVVTPLSRYRSHNQPSLVKAILNSGHTVFSISLDNLSDSKIIYNPSFSHIVDNRLGYKRPLDYTDLYFIVREMEHGEAQMGKMRGRFYDLAETVQPGKRVEKLLIFPPLEENSTKAALTMEEVYVGTETMKLTFSFALASLPITPEASRER
ncbi:MAG: hypothetical protein ACE5D4_06770 [Thermodesulfobacteriota bacterium]